ncbi:MAG: acyl-CoA dehydratase activase-related protein [Halanaerobiales bacterium]
MNNITFPHMGEMSIPVKAFFNELGYNVIEPPKISRKTLDLGVKYSPEFACLPLKINLGNFIEALDKGANTIVMGGGCGPCRFGYYAEVQREILRELGYDFEVFVIEPNLIENYRNVRRIFGNVSLRKLYSAARLAWCKAVVVDEIYKLVLRRRATEVKVGEVDKLYNSFLYKLEESNSVREIKKLETEYKELINQTRADFKQGIEIRIGLVGEIYLVLEPFVNLNIEKKLGELGVVVEKKIYMTQWLLHFLHLSNDGHLIERAAEKYLNSFVGGHGQDTVGNAVRFAELDLDGVIQLAPFTCMPEIISQTILPAVSKDKGIPVLTLFFDEHSADAGLQTRLEAFVDLLIRKKESRNKVLYQ